MSKISFYRIITLLIGLTYSVNAGCQQSSQASDQVSIPPVSPVPMNVYLSDDSIPRLEEKAYNGDIAAVEALHAHYLFFTPDEKDEVYWMIIGAYKGSAHLMLSFPQVIKFSKTVEEKERLHRLAIWVWKKYSSSWSTREKQSVLNTFKVSQIYLDSNSSAR